MSELTGRGKQFYVELVFALLVTGLACCAGFSNLLLASNDLYPGATDALGHMAKVQYIAEALKSGILPSAFPYWYNGTTVAQYYPPLSYWIMALIYGITKNIMLTFKIDCFLVIFSGGMGVWYFCRRYIASWCGLFGTIVFCLQPYVLITFLYQGQVAQGPVVALLPWYLIMVLSYAQKPTAKGFSVCTVICFFMILGHPNTAFMYCICIILALAFLLPGKRITLLAYFFTGLSIGFAGMLTAFWSLVGVTKLENPTIPKLLGEAVAAFSATIDWFLDPGYYMYFSMFVLAGSILGTLVFSYLTFGKKSEGKKESYVLFCIILTFFSVVFSFGLRIPFFEYLPMAEAMVAGRILCLTSISAAILCAYLLSGLQTLAANKNFLTKAFAFTLCLALVAVMIFNLNPFSVTYGMTRSELSEKIFAEIDNDAGNFEKGRYTFIGPYDCSQTFFPLQYGFNLAEGYNIEGTPHNTALWNQVIANSTGTLDYVAKNMAFWNVRYVLAGDSFVELQKALNKGDQFVSLKEKVGVNLFVSQKPSSYFLMDKRDGLVLGPGAPGVAMQFPYLVYEERNGLSDYSIEELEKYGLVYLCEPAVDTLQEKENVEKKIRGLVRKGITVIIEPVTTKGYTLFDVTTSEVPREKSSIIKKQENSAIESEIETLAVERELATFKVLTGLDKAFYKLFQNGGRLENDVIGSKKVDGGEVVFVGMHLSQYLKAVYARNRGMREADEYPPYCNDVEALFQDIFVAYGVHTDFWPDSFPVEKVAWNDKGVDFEYSNQETQEMTLSLTYTPRWKATIDGKPLLIGQRENLITLDLPAGNHKVTLKYGITKYGAIGYACSLFALFAFALLIRYYSIIYQRVELLYRRFLSFLQIEDKA